MTLNKLTTATQVANETYSGKASFLVVNDWDNNSAYFQRKLEELASQNALPNTLNLVSIWDVPNYLSVIRSSLENMGRSLSAYYKVPMLIHVEPESVRVVYDDDRIIHEILHHKIK